VQMESTVRQIDTRLKKGACKKATVPLFTEQTTPI